MRVLVTGGRDFLNAGMIGEVLDHWVERGATQFITGEAPSGVDRLVKDWCGREKFPYQGWPANWEDAGKAAGRARNEEMFIRSRPNYVLAFPGGDGTAHMTTFALTQGCPVAKVRVQWILEHFEPEADEVN